MHNIFPKRKENRLQGYDYSQNGAYFITICIKGRQSLLWEVVGARIARPSLSKIGQIVEKAICQISSHYPHIQVGKYVVMPNHVHLLLQINKGNSGRAMRAPTISKIVNQMKGYVTKKVGYSIWQKLFHDRIIRNEAEYLKIWQYIDENPARWAEDMYFATQ